MATAWAWPRIAPVEDTTALTLLRIVSGGFAHVFLSRSQPALFEDPCSLVLSESVLFSEVFGREGPLHDSTLAFFELEGVRCADSYVPLDELDVLWSWVALHMLDHRGLQWVVRLTGPPSGSLIQTAHCPELQCRKLALQLVLDEKSGLGPAHCSLPGRGQPPQQVRIDSLLPYVPQDVQLLSDMLARLAHHDIEVATAAAVQEPCAAPLPILTQLVAVLAELLQSDKVDIILRTDIADEIMHRVFRGPLRVMVHHWLDLGRSSESRDTYPRRDR